MEREIAQILENEEIAKDTYRILVKSKADATGTICQFGN